MEALALPSLSTPRFSPSNSKYEKKCCTRNYSGTSYSFNQHLFYGQFNPVLKSPFPHRWKVPRMQVAGEEYELRQMKDMAAARKRWEALGNGYK